MKGNKVIAICITIVMICSQVGFLSAQWLTNSNLGNKFYQTDPANNVEAVGIGDFAGFSSVPAAALDIVIPFLPSTNYPAGEAIHTTTVNHVDHFWKMFTDDGTTVTEKFRLWNPGTYPYEDNVILDAMIGNLDFDSHDTHWMRLHTNGNLGLSNLFTSGFVARSLFHMNNTGNNDVWQQITNGNTGFSTASDGFSIGLNYAASYPGAPRSFAKLIQHEDAPMKFYTNDIDRMIINSTYTPTIHSRTVTTTGFVGIGAPNFWGEETGGEGPRSLLHLQGNYNAFTNGGLGWRTWNRTGIYINENSDEMYVGLKDESAINGTNRSDAIIMWGDDQLNVDDGTADNFRLIFSGANGDGNGTGTNPLHIDSKNGLETMRMTPFGKMGIGPLFNWSTPPAKRLEVLDYQNSNGNSLDEAQLRLTYTQGSIFTDFQTKSAGYLYINPSGSRTGVSTPSPITTLHVGGTPGSTGDITSDYLNHSATPAIPSSFPYIVYSNTNGTLRNLRPATTATNVLHGDGSWSDVVSIDPTCTTGAVNFVTRFYPSTSTICKSQIWDNLIDVGIGTTILALGEVIPQVMNFKK